MATRNSGRRRLACALGALVAACSVTPSHEATRMCTTLPGPASAFVPHSRLLTAGGRGFPPRACTAMRRGAVAARAGQDEPSAQLRPGSFAFIEQSK